ncbi:MAG: hypothetical protein HY516_03655 [Candidatus Aenigmarchaeota archaeon]|nr:hypothetical protein [Candidatus Aenigmarchaeota archaeon]
MSITYPGARRFDDKVTRPELLSDFRPFTFLADLLTGVVERREAHAYNPSRIREWVRDKNEIDFRIDTDYQWRPRGPPGVVRIRGSPDEIVSDIESFRNWSWSDNPLINMQYLRYRDGRVKITVNDPCGPVYIYS